MGKQINLLQGTLDMLILKAVSLSPLHGYGVLLRIQQISGEQLQIQQGSLYPALYRPGTPGLDRQRVGRIGQQAQGKVLPSDCGRARRQLHSETEKWNRMTSLIASILRTTPEEV